MLSIHEQQSGAVVSAVASQQQDAVPCQDNSEWSLHVLPVPAWVLAGYNLIKLFIGFIYFLQHRYVMTTVG